MLESGPICKDKTTVASAAKVVIVFDEWSCVLWNKFDESDEVALSRAYTWKSIVGVGFPIPHLNPALHGALA